MRHGGGGSASGNKDHCVGHCCRVHRRLVSPQLVGPDGMCRARPLGQAGSALSSETRSMNCLLASPSWPTAETAPTAASSVAGSASLLAPWPGSWARFMTASRGWSESWPSSRMRRAARPRRLRRHIRTTSRRKVAMSAELLFAALRASAARYSFRGCSCTIASSQLSFVRTSATLRVSAAQYSRGCSCTIASSYAASAPLL